MEELFASTTFRIYAAVSAVLGMKMMLVAGAVGTLRTVKQQSPNPEDEGLLGVQTAPDGPFVARLNRGLRNSAESEPLFMILGLLYFVMGSVEPWGMQAYAYTFLGARLLHTVFYTMSLSPWRTVAWLVGWLVNLGLSVQILMTAFS